jgi:long-chain acyl-CoA synthetase
MSSAFPWLASYVEGDKASLFEPRFNDGLTLFRHAVATSGEAPAVHYFDRTLSYAEVDRLSDRFAAWLIGQGVGPGDRVALYLQNVPQFLICVMGAWKAGAIGVSINPMNRARELTLLLEDSQTRVLVAHRDLYEHFARDVLTQFPQVKAVTTSSREFQTRNDPRIFSEDELPPCEGTADLAAILENQAEGSLIDLRRSAEPDEPAVLVYTSGTTGVPKGAVITHANFANSAELWRAWYQLREGGPVLAIAPLFHITGLAGHVGLAMATCAPLILSMRFHPEVVAEAAQERQAEFVVGAITAFIALMNAPGVYPRQLASLKAVYTGGAPVPASVAAEFERKFSLQVRNTYGLTESTSVAVAVPRSGPAPIDAQGSLSVGIPIFETEASIVGEDGKVLAAGEVGEVLLRGPQIARGYWQRPQETSESFVDGWLRTGDVGYMNEKGWLFLVDRKKDMIIASGYKVWPKEVEDVIYSHSAVREAAVVGMDDPYRGQTVKAVVSLKPGQSLEPDALIAYCKERMAAYKYPRIVEIIDELPKTVTGKILRRALR